MPRSVSSRLQGLHRRALLNALHSAGGNVEHAARLLGVDTAEILAAVEGDPSVLWRTSAPTLRSQSGTRPRVTEADADDE